MPLQLLIDLKYEMHSGGKFLSFPLLEAVENTAGKKHMYGCDLKKETKLGISISWVHVIIELLSCQNCQESLFIRLCWCLWPGRCCHAEPDKTESFWMSAGGIDLIIAFEFTSAVVVDVAAQYWQKWHVCHLIIFCSAFSPAAGAAALCT